MSVNGDSQPVSTRDSPQPNGTPDLEPDAGSPLAADDDDDLFGDDDDDNEAAERTKRLLDDEELDSGDDLGRDDRLQNTIEDGDDQEEEEGREALVTATDLARINYPKGNEFYLLNMPAFLGIHQPAFDESTYEPQTVAHDGDPTRETSMYSTAMSSIFWRRDPNDYTENGTIQSTGRFIKWEDGSVTLQLATKPNEQYSVATNAMKQTFKKKLPPGTAYDPAKDSHTFLAAQQSSSLIDIQLIHALDASMKIRPAGGATDESQSRLKQALATAREDHNPLARMKEIKEDPELARKAAEQFEKDRVRAQRKRENAEERQTARRQGVLGRSGLGAGRSVGLSVAGLEDDMGMPISRGRKNKPKRNRYGEIYSDGEDETLPRGRTREDEYDREDDFLVDSDEEPEEYNDDQDILDDEEDPDKDDLDPEEPKPKAEEPRRERERTPKRSRMDEVDEDDDAEGEIDDELLRNSPQAARKKRRVIDDEDEEE